MSGLLNSFEDSKYMSFVINAVLIIHALKYVIWSKTNLKAIQFMKINTLKLKTRTIDFCFVILFDVNSKMDKKRYLQVFSEECK